MPGNTASPPPSAMPGAEVGVAIGVGVSTGDDVAFRAQTVSVNGEESSYYPIVAGDRGQCMRPVGGDDAVPGQDIRRARQFDTDRRPA